MEINTILFERIDGATHQGKLRKAMEYAGTRKNIYKMYLHPEFVQREMGELVTWINAQFENPSMNPIEVATTAHRWFISIHPFGDANGRTSRLIHDYILRRAGLPPALASNDEFAIFGAQQLIQGANPDKFNSDVTRMKNNINNFLDQRARV
jgi:Fic family protein